MARATIDASTANRRLWEIGIGKWNAFRRSSSPRPLPRSGQSSDAENAPDYRIHLGDADGPEIGAGWKRTGEKAGEYVSLVIDDPALHQPIRANLFHSGDDKSAWVLNWNRPPKRGQRD